MPRTNHIDKLKSILSEKYDIVSLIASGGMGEVYLAIHKVLGKKRAIKIIHQEVEKEKDIRQRFLQEAKLASSIDHPGIIQIIDFGSYDEFDYLIMPYIDGVTLRERMEQSPFELDDALNIMISMVDALSYAHKKNIIHRDIKPANYMIDAQGKVVLTDFGISKKLTEATMTAANTILGSPKFMSPEQITGKKVDPRSDLYSLGMIFYQMITRVYPFESEDIASLTYKQVHEAPRHPNEVNPGIPKEIGDIIMRLLEKDPDNRYADADLLLADLRKHAHPQPDASESKTVIVTPQSQGKIHEMATRIIQPVQKTILKKKDTAELKGAPTVMKARPSLKSGKKKLWLISAACAGLLALIFLIIQLAIHTTRQDQGRTISEQTSGQVDKEAIGKKPGISGGEKQVSSTLALRSRDARENEMLSKIENAKGAVSENNVRNLLALKAGFAAGGEGDPQTRLKMKAFLEDLSFVRFSDNEPCDVLISEKGYSFGKKLTVSSNLYECETGCFEEFIFENEDIPLSKIELIIQRNYCFNAFAALQLISSTHAGKSIDLEVPGKTKTDFIVGEEVKFCMKPDHEAHCMLLDINIDGISKLFPMFEDQRTRLKLGETQCSIDIKVSPPTGNEMIVVLGASREDLISPYARQFNPKNPIFLWSFEKGDAHNAITLCEQLFSTLVNAPADAWRANSRLIRISPKI